MKQEVEKFGNLGIYTLNNHQRIPLIDVNYFVDVKNTIVESTLKLVFKNETKNNLET